MSEKIDYDAYLKQLGDIDTNQKNRLKTYLEEQCKHDDALKACYDPDRMDDCYEFFKKCFEEAARKKREETAIIEDAVGYKIARDYFIEILPNLKKEEPEKETEKKADGKSAEAPAEEKPVEITPAVETVKEVAQQIEKDATSDNIKRDEYGFEVFGEEADEPEESEEETTEEPCHQEEAGKEEPVIYEGEGEDEIVQTIVEDDCITVTGRPKTEEETAEAPEIKAPEPNVEDDVFLSGQAFNAGDIIDKHGRRIFFKDLMPGMRFVRADYPDSLQYMVVCVVKNIKESRFSYDNNEHYISRYSGDSKESFDSDTSKCGGFGYAVPGDAMIIGKIENGERKLFEEAVTAKADYDNEGNGLLFGF